jgi:hypothetical protein
MLDKKMEMLDMFVATLVAVSVFLSTFFFIVEIELQCIEKMQYEECISKCSRYSINFPVLVIFLESKRSMAQSSTKYQYQISRHLFNRR